MSSAQTQPTEFLCFPFLKETKNSKTLLKSETQGRKGKEIKKMRTSNTINTNPSSNMTTTSTPKPTFSPPAIVQKSPWHSPLPYLFGGLAAMLGLIAFALLILACSYWRLSSNLSSEENVERSDVEAGDEKPDSAAYAKATHVFEEKIVVIMAGDLKPTFLATPISSRASFEDATRKNEKMEKEMEDTVEKPKQETTTESINRDQNTSHDQTQESSEQNQ